MRSVLQWRPVTVSDWLKSFFSRKYESKTSLARLDHCLGSRTPTSALVVCRLLPAQAIDTLDHGRPPPELPGDAIGRRSSRRCVAGL